MNALSWLKTNNPLYADIDINDNWLEESLANDADLFAGLVKQPDKCNRTELCTKYHDSDHVNTEPTSTTSNNLYVVNNDLIAASSRLQALARENGFTIHDVPGDGNCLFNAIMHLSKSRPPYHTPGKRGVFECD